MSPAPPYVPLWVKSNFSFLEGASHPEELLDHAATLGLSALALTDRDGVPGVVRAHARAKQRGGSPRLLIGAEVSVAAGPLEVDPDGPWSRRALRAREDPPPRSTLVLLAMDRGGYGNLCRLLTLGRRPFAKGVGRVSWELVAEHAEGLLALWGGEESLLVREEDPGEVPGLLADAFGDRLYALMTRHRRAEEVHQEARLRTRARRHGIRLVAATEVLYHRPARRDLQDVLTCIRHGVSLAEAGRRLEPNAGHALLSPAEMAARFADEPALVARSLEVAARCTFSLAELSYRYPSERLPTGLTSTEWLRRLTFEGAYQRFPGGPPEHVLETIEKELALIEELDYGGYFLTMEEIVRFCREHGILCQGRGSAANSAVCYCLGITAVDPSRIDVFFERFLSRERAEPPDIDLDIAHERREEVIQHVYQRYGRERAAMVAMVIRYRTRSAVREVGKALGLPAVGVERLAKLVAHAEGLGPEVLEAAGMDPNSGVHAHLIRLVDEIRGFPRHLATHPGGFLLGHEPLLTLVPVENAAMEDRTVIQWDKDDLEELGLFKVDLLGLGALTQLDRAFRLVEEHYGRALTMDAIPEDDPETYQMIQRADTVGVFQIESRAQMSMLPRLLPERFYDLVIEVSIIRPGPITGGMVHPYLRRRRGQEPVVYPHPSLRPVLEKTLGVPLFQEQVMRLAVVAADYTPGEADQLRRDMAAWRRGGRIERHRARLVGRMTAKGIDAAFAEQVFAQIEGFGEYGFPESHAVSFALIAYATSWLKRHYPDVFLCALLDAQPMGFYSVSTLVSDARRHGVEVRPVDIVKSGWDCRLEPREEAPEPASGEGGGVLAVRMGLRFVKGLSQARDWARIEAARTAAPFRDVDDLARRARLEGRALRRLAEAGALEPLRPGRRDALWQVARAARRAPDALPLPDPVKAPTLPGLDAFEEVVWDHRASAHSTRGHPVEALRGELRARGLPTAREVAELADGARVHYAGVVICRQRPGTAGGTVFMTMEDETGFVNVILWGRVFEHHRVLVKTTSFLGVTGKVQTAPPEDRGPDGVAPSSGTGAAHVIADSLWEPEFGTRPEELASRDFH